MSKKPKFKDRYVLGEGYPWALGTGPYYEVRLDKEHLVGERIEINWPPELWEANIPQYRLVLERVK